MHAKGLMLVEASIPGELAPHKRQGASDAGARLLNFVHGMRRFELHPIDARDVCIRPQPLEAVREAPVGRIAGAALGHDDEIGVQLVLPAQFRAICSSSILADTLGYAVSFSSPRRGKRRVFEQRKPVLMDQLHPSKNADNLSDSGFNAKDSLKPWENKSSKRPKLILLISTGCTSVNQAPAPAAESLALVRSGSVMICA
jgi:hypothetical protein